MTERRPLLAYRHQNMVRFIGWSMYVAGNYRHGRTSISEDTKHYIIA